MKFFGKFYVWYLLSAFVVGGLLSIIFKDFAFLNFMVFTVFLWAVAVVVERLVDDSRHLYRDFFVGFDWLELFIMSMMATVMFLNFLNTVRHSNSPSGLLALLMAMFGFFIVLSNVRSWLLKSMVHFEWDGKMSLIKSTIDKVGKGEEVDTDTASMVSKILVEKFDWSLRTTGKAVGKSATTVKRYLERKDSKLVL